MDLYFIWIIYTVAKINLLFYVKNYYIKIIINFNYKTNLFLFDIKHISHILKTEKITYQCNYLDFFYKQ